MRDSSDGKVSALGLFVVVAVLARLLKKVSLAELNRSPKDHGRLPGFQRSKVRVRVWVLTEQAVSSPEADFVGLWQDPAEVFRYFLAVFRARAANCHGKEALPEYSLTEEQAFCVSF